MRVVTAVPVTLHPTGPLLDDAAYAHPAGGPDAAGAGAGGHAGGDGGAAVGGAAPSAWLAQQRGVLAQLLAAPLRDTAAALCVAVPMSDVWRKLTALLATFR
jgi:hypothetical protein